MNNNRIRSVAAVALLACTPRPVNAQAFAVGGFSKSTCTAPCDQGGVAHGLGTTPAAIIFWTDVWPAGSDTTNCVSCQFSMGWTDGTTSRSISTTSTWNQTTQKTERRMANKMLTVVTTTPTVTFEGDMKATPWDATNFYITWTTNTASATYIHFIALGGTGVQAKALTFTAPTTANSNVYTTGVGFQPSLVMFMHAFGLSAFTSAPPANLSGEAFGLGVMDGGGNQWTITEAGNTGVTDDSQRGQLTNQVIYGINSSLGDTYKAAACVSPTCPNGPMDTDGFHLNWSLVGGSAQQIFALALNNVNFKIGSFSKTTQTTGLPFNQSVTGVGFQPRAVMFVSDAHVATSSAVATIAFNIGASDGTHQGSSNFVDIDLNNPTETYNGDRQTSRAFMQHYIAASPWQGTSGEANLTTGSGSLDPDGFTLSWQSQSDATAMQILYLALGSLNVSSVTLASFTATRLPDGKVRLDWRTGYEVDNVGFRLYREQNGKRMRITSSIVLGSALMGGGRGMTVGGRTYTWSDSVATPPDGGTVQYWLEDVDLKGKSTWHGPFVPTPSPPREPR